MGQNLCSYHNGYEVQCENDGEIECNNCKNKWCTDHIFACNYENCKYKVLCRYCCVKIETEIEEHLNDIN